VGNKWQELALFAIERRGVLDFCAAARGSLLVDECLEQG
jgi:hypothetical protein